MACGVAQWETSLCFFFNDTATTEIYTLSLHDALPISRRRLLRLPGGVPRLARAAPRVRARAVGRVLQEGHRPPVAHLAGVRGDRKSTRLNSSHANISYAVFCLIKNIPLCRTDAARGRA